MLVLLVVVLLLLLLLVLVVVGVGVGVVSVIVVFIVVTVCLGHRCVVSKALSALSPPSSPVSLFPWDAADLEGGAARRKLASGDVHCRQPGHLDGLLLGDSRPGGGGERQEGEGRGA